jgi:hypothetical protein
MYFNFFKTVIIFLILFKPVYADNNLQIIQDDLILKEGTEGGFHLWIRKKDGIGSVLLTESTVDPEKKLDIYALRSETYNSVNGDEKRILNGEFLDSNKGIIDSTPESHDIFGEAFHLFIPYIVVYGYPGSRNGEIQVTEGTFLNIKTFSLPYADWSGNTMDNPFLISILPEEEQKVAPEGSYKTETVNEFIAIADEGNGESVFSPENEDIIPSISEILESVSGNSLDLVLALDTTLSMKDELPYLKEELIPFLSEYQSRFNNVRYGLLFYKDYNSEYLYKDYGFMDGLEQLQTDINRASARGGGDIPEAVYEALYYSIDLFNWLSQNRIIILIGDAPPHPRPRSSITQEMVYSMARDNNIRINTIIISE